jgi:hypothetical protein
MPLPCLVEWSRLCFAVAALLRCVRLLATQFIRAALPRGCIAPNPQVTHTMEETTQRDGRRRRNRNRSRRDGEGRPERRSDRPGAKAGPSGFSKFLSVITFGLIGGKQKPSSGGARNPRPVTNVTYVNGATEGPRSERSDRGGREGREGRDGRPERERREPRPPMAPREVTSERLHVGNLSFDASESDLFELFNGVGSVRNAEIVVNKHNQRSKGFGFVTMSSMDEAKRAVAELNNKEFMGRALNVGGAKPPRDPREARDERDERDDSEES